MARLELNNYIFELDSDIHSVYNDEDNCLLIGAIEYGFFKLGAKISFVQFAENNGLCIEYIETHFKGCKFVNFLIVVKDNVIKIKQNNY